jgi:hypothetical protein
VRAVITLRRISDLSWWYCSEREMSFVDGGMDVEGGLRGTWEGLLGYGVR